MLTVPGEELLDGGGIFLKRFSEFRLGRIQAAFPSGGNSNLRQLVQSAARAHTVKNRLAQSHLQTHERGIALQYGTLGEFSRMNSMAELYWSTNA